MLSTSRRRNRCTSGLTARPGRPRGRGGCEAASPQCAAPPCRPHGGGGRKAASSQENTEGSRSVSSRDGARQSPAPVRAIPAPPGAAATADCRRWRRALLTATSTTAMSSRRPEERAAHAYLDRQVSPRPRENGCAGAAGKCSAALCTRGLVKCRSPQRSLSGPSSSHGPEVLNKRKMRK